MAKAKSKAKAKAKSSTAPKFQNISVPLGVAPVGATISFHVHDGPGFEANAILLQETQTLGTWVSSELLGETISETIATPGFTVLQITCVFTSANPSSVAIDFQLGNDPPVQVSFSGQKGDVVRTLADFFIV